MTRVMERVLLLDGTTTYGRELVGNKGASIARMRSLGLAVPPAFALPIEECRRYHAAGEQIDEGCWQAVIDGVGAVERQTGRRLGDPDSPLLVSVRSAGAVSMPGMMDTILNLGITDEVEQGLARLSGDPSFARETHVRFVHEFGHTVLGAHVDPPEDDTTAGDVRAAVLDDTGAEVPTDPHDQLRAAIRAVFASWGSRRAVAYRRHWGIPEEGGGTAVIVQAMVFGNLGERSGTGVLFTRDPLSGAPEPYGEWLAGGQGEDVVSGTHDPSKLSTLREELSQIHDELIEAGRLLEQEHRDVQDIEFTVEDGRLYLLQARAAKRSPLAAVRTAVDFVAEGRIDRATALERISPEQLASVLAPRLHEGVTSGAEVLARGTPACPGVASGTAVASSDEAADGDTVLARPTTSPEDVPGMIAARAVVTEHGGSTSHAAVVTRALGRPSVVGVGEGETAAWAGREVTVDGTAGVVYAGVLPTEEVRTQDVPGLDQAIEWLRELSPVNVMAEADDVLDLDAAGVALDPEEKVDVDALAERIRGAAAVKGSILSTDAGASAVLRSGVDTIVRLPGQHEATLLLRLVRAKASNEEEKAR